jgi:hypothetical protein
MNSIILDISAYSIFLPILISILRFKMIGDAYYPFIYLLWIGGCNEILSAYLLSHDYYNVYNTNIYSLLEGLLLLWFFRNTSILERVKMLFPFLIVLFITTWSIENFIVGNLGLDFNSYFNIIAALCIVLISINIINDILMKDRDILTSPTFLLCIGFVIYFTYRILVEAFLLNGLGIGKSFMSKVNAIHTWINLLCNLIYALAVLWMQRRQAFTLRY